MSIKIKTGLIWLLAALLLLGACYPNPAPPNLTPIPTLAPASSLTPVGSVAAQPTQPRPATAPPAAAGAVQPASTPSGAPAAGSSASGGNAQQGAALFQTHCVACHGPNGQGTTIAPKLQQNQFVKTQGAQAVFDTISNGRPGTAMPTWSKAKGGSLTDAQIRDLVAYVESLQ